MNGLEKYKKAVFFFFFLTDKERAFYSSHIEESLAGEDWETLSYEEIEERLGSPAKFAEAQVETQQRIPELLEKSVRVRAKAKRLKIVFFSFLAILLFMIGWFCIWRLMNPLGYGEYSEPSVIYYETDSNEIKGDLKP